MFVFDIRKFLKLFLSFAFFILTSCSPTELAINWADTFLAWKINSQFDFSGEDKKTVKTESTRFVTKIKRERFPLISQALHESGIELKSLNWNSTTEIQSWVERKTAWSDRFISGLASDVEPFAVRISNLVKKDNWEHFLENFESENQKISKEKSRCEDKFRDNIEPWLGGLNQTQKNSVQKFCETRKKNPEVRIRNRMHLLEVFRSWAEPQGEFDSAAFTEATKKWVRNYRSLNNQEAQENLKASETALIKALSEILSASSDSQRKKLIDSFEAKSQMFNKLSR